MKSRLNQFGVGHIAAVFVLVFLAVVGFAGYKVWSLNRPVADTVSSVSAKPVVPAKINSKADLGKAAKALDSSSGDVNNNLNDNSLNSDLNDML